MKTDYKKLTLNGEEFCIKAELEFTWDDVSSSSDPQETDRCTVVEGFDLLEVLDDDDQPATKTQREAIEKHLYSNIDFFVEEVEAFDKQQELDSI